MKRVAGAVAAVVALGLTGCSAASAQLTAPDTSGANCAPEHPGGGTVIAFAMVTNEGGGAAVLVGASLVGAQNLKIIAVALLPESVEGHHGVGDDPVKVGPFPGDAPIPVPAGEQARVQTAVKLTDRTLKGNARSVRLEYVTEGSDKVHSVDTPYRITCCAAR